MLDRSEPPHAGGVSTDGQGSSTGSDQLDGEGGRPAFCAIVGAWAHPFIAQRLQGLHRGVWRIPAEAFAGAEVDVRPASESESEAGRSWCCGLPIVWEEGLASCMLLPVEELWVA